jgi:hypothetical protein
MLVCCGALAAPPIERPSPPPCCADGQCLANPFTFGVYATRWRQWPVKAYEPTQAGAATVPAKTMPELPAYEAPPPEQEDRKAPPPTTPAAETGMGRGNAAGPGGGVGQGGAVGPAPGPGTSPPSAAGPGFAPQPMPIPPQGTGPAFTPNVAPTGTPTNPMPGPGAPTGQPTSPLYRNVPQNSPLNKRMPTGDLDPPPALPFNPQPIERTAPVRAASRPVSTRTAQPQAQPVLPPTGDPPPSPPGSLASWQN